MLKRDLVTTVTWRFYFMDEAETRAWRASLGVILDEILTELKVEAVTQEYHVTAAGG